ncbi:MAG: alpha/beta hydrolase, partial [Promethearchaeota archaeon]
MTLLISPKLRSDVKKIMELRNSYAEIATEEFLSKKKSQGIKITEKTLLSDRSIALEYQRYLSAFTAQKRNVLIPKTTVFERINTDGVPAEWIITPNAEKKKVLFHLFGGGYVMGTIETRRWLPFLMARASKIRALIIGYRLAPEHPFPVALEDSITAYRWVLSTGISSQNIVLSGDSAGGALVVSTLIRLRELNLPLPAGAVLLSPWTDLACTGGSLESNA